MFRSSTPGLSAVIVCASWASAATAQSPVWDDPVIGDLIMSRPALADAEHDLPTLRRTLTAEGRDEAWANPIEARLNAQLNADMPVEGAVDRRAVRCGRSICEISVIARTDAEGARRRSAAFDAVTRRTAYALGLNHRSTASVFDETRPTTQAIVAYFSK